MRVIDIVIPFVLIGVVAVSGIFYLNEWQLEQEEERLEAQQVADNWKGIKPHETSCDEIKGKLISLNDENFSGVDLIKNALTEKYMEMDC